MLTSPYRGVSFHACTQRWRARIKYGGKSKHLGYYRSDLEAASAYDVATFELNGEKANFNLGAPLETIINAADGSTTTTEEEVENLDYFPEEQYSSTKRFSKPVAFAPVYPVSCLPREVETESSSASQHEEEGGRAAAAATGRATHAAGSRRHCSII